MKNASSELVEFLASTDSKNLKIADLYTITLTNGLIWRLTSADFDIKHSGNTYSCQNAGISRSEMSWQQGLSVDDVMIELNPSPNDRLGSISLVEAFRNGSFDGAEIQLDMAFYKNGWKSAPLILEKLFVGNMDVEEVSGSYVKLTIKSLTELLNTSFPADVYQTACHYPLYGTGCGVNRTNFAENSIVQSGSTKKQLNCSLTKVAGYYQNGIVEFTSGTNINIKKSIKLHTSGVITLSTPLQYAPQVGDTFAIFAGCDKTMATCKGKFNNLDNFSGTPFIPKPDSAL